jgi:hypothetical protein
VTLCCQCQCQDLADDLVADDLAAVVGDEARRSAGGVVAMNQDAVESEFLDRQIGRRAAGPACVAGAAVELPDAALPGFALRDLGRQVQRRRILQLRPQ